MVGKPKCPGTNTQVIYLPEAYGVECDETWEGRPGELKFRSVAG